MVFPLTKAYSSSGLLEHNVFTFDKVNDDNIVTLISSSLEAKLETKQFSMLLEFVIDT